MSQTVGSIALDLVVRDTVEAQLDRILTKAQKLADSAGKALDEAISAPVHRAQKNLDKSLEDAAESVEDFAETAAETVSKALDKAVLPEISAPVEVVPEIEVPDLSPIVDDGIEDAIQRELKRLEDMQKAALDTADLPDRVRTVKPSSMQFDPSAVKFMDEYEEKLNQTAENVQKKLNDAVEFEVSADPLKRLEQQIANAEQKLELLQKKWQELSAAEPTDKIRQQLTSVQEKIISTTEKLDKLQQKAAQATPAVYPQMPEIPLDDHVPTYIERVREELSKLSDSVLEPLGGVERLREISGKALDFIAGKTENLRSRAASVWENVSTAAASSFDRAKTAVSGGIDAISQRLDALRPAAERFGSALRYPVNVLRRTASAAQTILQPLQGLGNAAERGFSAVREAASRAFGSVRRTGSAALSAIRRTGSAAFRTLRNVGGRAVSGIAENLRNIGRNALNVMNPVRKLGNTLRSSFKSVFLAAGLYGAFRALKDGLLEAANADQEFSRSLSAVKANLAVAFVPITNAVMPLLNTLMSGLASVTRQVAGFISGIFGTTYAQSAAAVKKLKGVTDAAKKAKLSLAGIDEMNILSSDSGDDESAGEIPDLSALDAPEPVLPDWAERLKSAILAGDWESVGAVLAERVNSVFQAVDWEKIEQKIVSVSGKICDLINGFLDNVDWSALGSALAGGINILTAAVNTFADKIHWQALGTNLAKGLNTAISKVKWGQLGRALSAHIRVLTDLLYGFVTEFDWAALGDGIGQAVNGWFDGIDFGKLGYTLSEGIKGILATVNAFLTTVDFGSIGRKIADFINNIDVAGILSQLAQTVSTLITSALDLLISFVQNVDWGRLGDSLWDGLVGIVTGIDWGGIVSRAFELLGSALGGAAMLVGSVLLRAWDTLKTAYDRLKKYFSDKIEEAGGNIWQGVLAGITDGLKNVGKWIKDHIFTPFIDGFKRTFGIASPSKEMAKLGGFLVDGLFVALSGGIAKLVAVAEDILTGIKNVFSNVKEWFAGKFSGAYNAVKGVFSGIGQWFGERYSDVTSAFSAVGNWFSEKFSGAWDGIKSAFSIEKVSRFFSDVMNGIRTVFSSVGNWFSEKFTSAADSVKDAFSGISDFFENIWDSIGEGATSGVNALIDIINGIIESVENGLNWISQGLNFFGFDVPEALQDLLGESFSFDLPEVGLPRLPHLANGALATAPTLALVGDNRNAAVDPEVISPLSKLQSLTNGDNSEIIALLQIIIELLRNGLSAEIVGGIFGSDFRKTVLKIIADDNTRRGG